MDSAYSNQSLLQTRTRGFLVEGPKCFRIPKVTFGLLDAVFSPDALCLTEPGGPVRCLDCQSGEERWRYEPPKYSHVLRLTFRPKDGSFYGVEGEYQYGRSRLLLRFSADFGQHEELCQLSSWQEVFCLGGDALVTSKGEVIRVGEGKMISRLPFPETEYPDKVLM